MYVKKQRQHYETGNILQVKVDANSICSMYLTCLSNINVREGCTSKNDKKMSLMI